MLEGEMKQLIEVLEESFHGTYLFGHSIRFFCN